MIDGKIPMADLVKHVGEEMGVSSWMTLDQTRIQEFAHCTGDHQWIHLDAERAARETRFGGTIAHGFLTLSLIAEILPTGASGSARLGPARAGSPGRHRN